MDNAVPNRVQALAAAVISQPGEQRAHGGAVVRQVIPALDEHRAACVRDMQAAAGQADPLDHRREVERIGLVHVVERCFKAG
jgi:hypothetical protein